ncbi:MAG: hypothetical protein ACLSHU_10245 [Oscillospiraceae bacterium]
MRWGSKFGRVPFLKDYASYVGDEMISDPSDFSRSLILSIDILPVPTDEAVKEVQSQILGIETDITRWQQRQNSKNTFTANVPYELEQLRNETREFLDDLTVRDQRMMFAVVRTGACGRYAGSGWTPTPRKPPAFHWPGTLMPVCGAAVSAGGWIEYGACPMVCAG